jgi:hypothetical protein
LILSYLAGICQQINTARQAAAMKYKAIICHIPLALNKPTRAPTSDHSREICHDSTSAHVEQVCKRLGWAISSSCQLNQSLPKETDLFVSEQATFDGMNLGLNPT